MVLGEFLIQCLVLLCGPMVGIGLEAFSESVADGGVGRCLDDDGDDSKERHQ